MDKEIFDHALKAAASALVCEGHYKIDGRGRMELCSRTATRAVVNALRLPPNDESEVWRCPCCEQIVDRDLMGSITPTV